MDRIRICSIDQSLSNTAITIFEINKNYYEKLKSLLIVLFDIKSEIKTTLRKKINDSKGIEDFFKKVFTGINSSISSAKKRSLYIEKLEELYVLYKSLLEVDSDYTHIETFSVSSKFKGMERVNEINNKYIEVAKKHNTVLTIMEGYALGIQQSSSIFDLGELGGVLKMSILKNQNNLIITSPNTLKMMFSGIGKNKKEVMKAKYEELITTNNKIPKNLENDDEIDSLALGYVLINKDSFSLIDLFTLSFSESFN